MYRPFIPIGNVVWLMLTDNNMKYEQLTPPSIKQLSDVFNKPSFVLPPAHFQETHTEAEFSADLKEEVQEEPKIECINVHIILYSSSFYSPRQEIMIN